MAEKDSLHSVIDEVNQLHGDLLGYRIELLRWETHSAPGGGRPQAVINADIPVYDIFVGIAWRRFGTPTGVADSGTEEEYRVAYRLWEKNNSMPLMFYFCQKPFMPRTIEEVEQVKKVLSFRDELRQKALDWEYEGPEMFAGKIRKHICLRMRGLVQDNTGGAAPNQKSIEDLHAVWPRMEPNLREAFSVAYNENRQAGDPGVQTRDLFAAMLRVAREQLTPIVNEIPKAALPAPVEGPVAKQPYIVGERPWLSHCVASSLNRLRKVLPEGRQLTATDVFIDIAKHGSGASVALLRQHNIGLQEIDSMLSKHGVEVLT